MRADANRGVLPHLMRIVALITLAMALGCGVQPPSSSSPPSPPSSSSPGTQRAVHPIVAPPPFVTGAAPSTGDCPAGVTCVDVLPYTATGTTVGGAHDLDQYSCAPDKNESGPERVYRVAIPAAGTLSVSLDASLEAGATDVDVHILSALDANTCLARGDAEASASVDAGFVFVALDSFDGDAQAGAFSASFVFTAAQPLGDDAAAAQVLVTAGVPPDVAALAAHAYNAGKAQGLTDSSVFSVVDFAMPSTEKRLWVVDLQSGETLVNDHVSHGIGSQDPNDITMASTFSNTAGSDQSSLGLVRTAEVYDGTHPHSLRLDGLEDSNSNMRDRAIVMHGADYAEDSFLSQNGYLGRSNGCFAVAQSREAGIVDIVKEGTLLWAYFPDPSWLSSSPFLQ